MTQIVVNCKMNASIITFLTAYVKSDAMSLWLVVYNYLALFWVKKSKAELEKMFR